LYSHMIASSGVFFMVNRQSLEIIFPPLQAARPPPSPRLAAPHTTLDLYHKALIVSSINFAQAGGPSSWLGACAYPTPVADSDSQACKPCQNKVSATRSIKGRRPSELTRQAEQAQR